MTLSPPDPAGLSDEAFAAALADAGLPRKLNVGCGYDKRPDHLNIDMDPACEPDVLIVDNDLSSLPRGYFTEILASDVVEHVPRNRCLAALLDWAELCAPGGRMHVSTSSIIGAVRRMEEKGEFEWQFNWAGCLFGNQAHPGDFHYNGFTEATLKVHLLAVGFEPGPISIVDGWLLKTTAIKIADWTDLARAPGLADAAFVQAAYRTGFDRDADSGAHQIWGGELAKGRSRHSVLKDIYSSAERLFATARRHGL